MSPSGLIDAVGALHLLRPHWLWALLALPALLWIWRARRRRSGAWRATVDPHLLPHLLDAQSGPRGRIAVGLGVLGYLLAVLALAGPSWRQIEQPLWQSRTPLVVALDLSSATLAGDLPPSRLAQARAKLETLLLEREGGQVGLVAYAGDAFTVAPLTDDAANVALFLDALHPEVMPVDGQRADRAIAWSAQLLRQAGFDRGRILLLTDHADAAARDAAAGARQAGYRVSVLGLGSAAGAPYRQAAGPLAHARLDAGSLRELARAGGGDYATLAGGGDDLRSLAVLDPDAIGDATATQGAGRSWQDEGYWLLLPLMLLALWAFRRGGAAVLLVCLWLPGQEVQAAELWRRPDQAAHDRMQQAAQAYRQQEFARAADLYDGVDSADGHYNRGNALAKAGRYPEAIEAYEQALRQQPAMADAIANKRAVEAAMKRKPPPGPKQGQPGSKPGEPQDPGGEGQPSAQDGQGDPQSPAPRQAGEPQSQPPPAGDAPGKEASDAQAKPADAQAQQEADAAQRERMQRALEQAKSKAGPTTEANADKPEETPEQREKRLANEAWLRRVPDDPGGLLREKFRIEHERRQTQGGLGE